MDEQQQPKSASKPSDYCVPYAQRYTAAWGELSQRLAARQSVYLQFATVSLAATSALLGVMNAAKDAAAVPWARGIAEWGAVGLIVYSWAFALWIRNNDAVVGLLGSFCRILERTDDPDGTSDFPAWHTEAQGWIVIARYYRQYSDWAAIIVTVSSSVPAFFFGVGHLKHCEVWPAARLLAAAIGGLSAAVFLWFNRSVRTRIASLTREDVREEARGLSGSK
jgi:hypothetical protein